MLIITAFILSWSLLRGLGSMKVYSSRCIRDLIHGQLVMFIGSTSKSQHFEGCQIEDLLHQIFSKDLLLYTFFFPRNRAKDSNPNRTFFAEFRHTFKDDEAYQRDKTLNGFLIS